MYLEEANANAIINAYTLAGKSVNIKSNDYKVIYVSSESDTDIKIGETLEVGEKVDVKVLRNDKEVDCYAKLINLDDEKVIGLYLVNVYDYEVDPEINLKFKWNESGPSGGFMLALAIYDRLIPEDLTKGRKIVGTGTIDSEGNVGEIGGVKYKLMGAVKNKADIFFVPKDNYDEAMKTKNKYKYDIDVVKVEKLEDAITYLKEH